MYVLIAGGGKVGANLARSLLRGGNEVTLIEQRPYRFDKLEAEFEHQVIRGDATELFVLERAGIKRPPDLLVAATGDDEDNIVICQLAREKYGVAKVIARINDPRNQPYFDLLGISPTVSATGSIMALIEHEVPEHGLIQLLELRKENLEIVEVTVDKDANCKGKRVRALQLPEGARLISVVRDGKAEIPDDETQLAGRRPGAGDPRARQGGRAPPRPARNPSRTATVGRASPGDSRAAGVVRDRRRADLDRLGADAGDGGPRATSSAASCRPASRPPRARSCSRSGSA